MKIKFYKYHGTGNDFVMIDNREMNFPIEDENFIRHLCHRRFGIGADGVICLENHPTDAYLYMRYFNANGKLGSMCGNGGRCFVHFANFLGLIKQNQFNFYAFDGLHKARVNENMIELEMSDVTIIDQRSETDFVLDTGSPHYVRFVENIDGFNVEVEGKKIRHSTEFDAEGINVNFIEIQDDLLRIKTFERGVEAVTYACGTGAVATAIATHKKLSSAVGNYTYHLKTDGGVLTVSFKNNIANSYTNITLKGEAVNVYKGKIGYINVN